MALITWRGLTMDSTTADKIVSQIHWEDPTGTAGLSDSDTASFWLKAQARSLLIRYGDRLSGAVAAEAAANTEADTITG